MNAKNKLIISACLISLAVACRLLPHAWNFAPVAAIALFSGAYLGRRYAVLVPIAAMLIGDLFIGFYAWQLMLAVYGSYIFAGLLGSLLAKNKSLSTVASASIIASVVFFLATNWAVWQFSPWYAKNLAGLIDCLVMALPFFRNTLAGDLFYVAVLFGSYEIIKILAVKRGLVADSVKNN